MSGAETTARQGGRCSASLSSVVSSYGLGVVVALLCLYPGADRMWAGEAPGPHAAPSGKAGGTEKKQPEGDRNSRANPLKPPDLEKIAAARGAELNLSFTDITPAALARMIQLRDLTRLDLWGSNITDAGLATLRLERLECLVLSHTPVTGKAIPSLPVGLQSLWLDWLPIKDSDLPNLARFTHLEGLGLYRTDVTDAGLPSLGKLENLHRLQLSMTRVRGKGLASLKDLRHLETLWLDKGDGGAEHHVAGSWFSKSSDLRGYPDEWRRRVGVTDLSMRDLPRLSSLRKLTLVCAELDPPDLRFVERVPDLRELNLSGTNVTDAGLEPISQLKNLESLSLTDVKISGDGLRYVAKCPALTRLDLSRATITPESLDHLSKLKTLKWLALCENALSDSDLPRLAALTQLEYLNVAGTKISEKALRDLPQSLPKLKTLVYGTPYQSFRWTSDRRYWGERGSF